MMENSTLIKFLDINCIEVQRILKQDEFRLNKNSVIQVLNGKKSAYSREIVCKIMRVSDQKA